MSDTRPSPEGTHAGKSNPANAPSQGPIPSGPPVQDQTIRNAPPRVEVQNRAMADPDLFALDPRSLDPNKAYRFVRVEQSGRPVLRKKLRGWQVERIQDQGGVKPLVDIEKRGDKAIVVGDGILMSRPRALHEERRRLQEARTQDLLNTTTAMVEAEAAAKGLHLIQDPDHLRSRNSTGADE